MRTFVALVVLYLVGSSNGFDCSRREQSSGVTSHYRPCNCNPHNPHQIYCPQIDFITVTVIPQYRKLQIQCGLQVEAKNLTQYLASLDIAESYPRLQFRKVNFEKCPLTEEPLVKLLGDIELQNIQSLDVMCNERKQNAHCHFNVTHFKQHFQNLSEVRTIRMSSFVSDDLVKLDSGMFEGIPHLKKIEISDNTFNAGTELDPKIFQPVLNLEQIILKDCDIKLLNEDIFKNLVKLKDLSLTDNKLTQLPQGLFRDLRKLQKLNLHDNNITELPPHIFDSLRNVQGLYLHKNSLVSLPSGIFDKMINLKVLKIEENKFTSLPGALFCNNVILTKLNWKNRYPTTKLQLPSDLFRNSSLTSIKMVDTTLDKIPEQLLAGKEDILELQIRSATIDSLPENLFKDTKNIGIIDFVNNQITKIPNGLFRNLRQLTKLRLYKNKITELSDQVFFGLENLSEINLSHNQIYRIDPNAFLSQRTSLLILNLGYNKIRLTKEQSFTKMSNNLKIINLEYNELDTMQEDWKNDKNHLQDLNLQGNNFGPIIRLNDVRFASSKLKLDLSLNAIEKILIFEDMTTNSWEQVPNQITIKIGGNPIICDCMLTKIKQRQKYNNIELLWRRGLLRCGQKSPGHLINQTMENVSYHHLNCEFPSGDYSVACPQPCQCHLNRYSRQVTVNCQNQQMKMLPQDLPLIPGEADSITLIMNHNSLHSIQDLNSLPNFHNIRQLFLSHNTLNHISGMSLPPNLTSLAIDNNNIQMIDNFTLQYLSNTIQNNGLKLGNNPYECSCNIMDLFNFIKSHQSLITDLGSIATSCSQNISQLSFTEVHYSNCLWSSHMSMASAGASAFLAIIMLTLVIIVSIWYKEPIFIWLYAQPWTSQFFTEDAVDREKPYDAFLSYSHLDAKFVEETLLEGLEQPGKGENKFKCCIHTRDWIPGEEIAKQIVTSIDQSRRTIIILSKNYVKSSWAQIEFGAAHNEALQENSQRVIVVKYGNLPDLEEMSGELQQYLQLTTYLDSEDPWFWPKLRYALPRRGRQKKQAKNRRRWKETGVELISTKSRDANLAV